MGILNWRIIIEQNRSKIGGKSKVSKIGFPRCFTLVFRKFGVLIQTEFRSPAGRIQTPKIIKVQDECHFSRKEKTQSRGIRVAKIMKNLKLMFGDESGSFPSQFLHYFHYNAFIQLEFTFFYWCIIHMNISSVALLLSVLAICLSSARTSGTLLGGFMPISKEKLSNLDKEDPNFAVALSKVKQILNQTCGIGLGKLIQVQYQIVQGITYKFTAETEYGQLLAISTVQYWSRLIQIIQLSFIDFNQTLSNSTTSILPNSTTLPSSSKIDSTLSSSLILEFQTIMAADLVPFLQEECRGLKKIKQKSRQSSKLTAGLIKENVYKLVSSQNKDQLNMNNSALILAIIKMIQNSTSSTSSPVATQKQELALAKQPADNSTGNVTVSVKSNSSSEFSSIKLLAQSTSLGSNSKDPSPATPNLQVNTQSTNKSNSTNLTASGNSTNTLGLAVKTSEMNPVSVSQPAKVEPVLVKIENASVQVTTSLRANPT